MNPDSPDWRPFEVHSPQLPSGLTPDVAVIAVARDMTLDRGWAADVTLGLARALSASGRNVLALDLDLDTPRLHRAAGVENGEGVSDAMLYGVSIRKIAQPIRQGEFLLVSAGTVVGDSRRVLESDAWIAMLGGVREAGAVALLHMPADAQGAASLLERADAVVLLGPPSMQMGGARVVARFGPAEAEVETAASVGGTVEGVDIDALAPDIETKLDVTEPEYASSEAMEVADPTDISRLAPEEPEDSEAGSDTFSLDDLPESEAGAEQAADELDTFSLSGVEGSQYDASGGAGAPPADGAAPVEESPPRPEAASMGGPPEPAEPSPPEEPDDAGMQRLEVEDSMIVDEGELDELADSAPMMEGLETGAGFSMGGPPEPADASPEEEPELEVTSSAEQLGTAPAVPEPAAEEPAVEAPAREAETAAPAEDVSTAAEAVPAEEEPPASSQETPTVVTGAGSGELRVQDEPRLAGLEKLEKQQKRSARARVAALVVFALVVLGGFGWTLAFTGILQVPGITPQERLGSGVLPPVDLPGPQPTTPELSHSLMMDTHRELETPRALIEVLTERVPGVLFFVAPVMEGDRQLFALYAAAYGAAEADALRETIGEVRDRLDPAEWRVLPTSYAFFIEEQGEAAVASETAAALMDQGVPTYVLQVDYPDGSAGYRVYAGAHVDENDAGPMARLLRASGFSDAQLTSRRGKLPE